MDADDKHGESTVDRERENRETEKASRESDWRRPPPNGPRNEFDLIQLLRERARTAVNPSSHPESARNAHHSSLSLGIGDDAAIVQQRTGLDAVITSDLLIEGVDFHLDWTNPRFLGHKALTVSLSDIAAMGARPRYALVSLGVPEPIWQSGFVEEFYEGLLALAEHYEVLLIGGDISRTPEHIVIDSIVLGEVENDRAVRRSTAKAGDHIFVTGTLGGAAAGLRLLESGARLSGRRGSQEDNQLEPLLSRQLHPEPRVPWGALLGEEDLATAMIDISDGLSSDLSHLCRESRVGAKLDAARIPIDPTVVEICGRRALDPLLLTLHGGEDFELLFTVRPADLKWLPQGLGEIPITYIGDVTAETETIRLVEGARESILRPAGFRHF